LEDILNDPQAEVEAVPDSDADSEEEETPALVR
jgi:hypothetical protein